MTTNIMNIEPTPEGYGRIARRFAEQILDDVRKKRQADDRKLLIEIARIASHLTSTGNQEVLARLIVAIEQNENDAIMPAAHFDE